MREDDRFQLYTDGKTQEEWLRTLPPETNRPGGSGSDWALGLVAGGVYGFLKTFLVPLAALVATLYIMAAPWWAEIYLIAMNAAAFYSFFQKRARPEEKATGATAVKLHAMTVFGGAVGSEIGRHLFCDAENRRPFRWSVFIGCLLIIWAVSSRHDRNAPSPQATATARSHHS
jgi:uncharacterized membrane protein YsdA (DUF1294 family)